MVTPKKQMKAPKTRFGMLVIGSDLDGYELPSVAGTPGQVLIALEKGKVEWNNLVETGPKRFHGRTECVNADEVIHVHFPSLGHKNYTIGIVMRHETWAKNPRLTQFYQLAITSKTESSFHVAADRPITIKAAEKYILEWTITEDEGGEVGG